MLIQKENCRDDDYDDYRSWILRMIRRRWCEEEEVDDAFVAFRRRRSVRWENDGRS